MDPSRRFYESIFESLGEDFRTHLEAGDLHLYRMNKNGELTKKGCCTGRTWVRMTNDPIASSIQTAKKMIMDKVNTFHQTNSLNLEPQHETRLVSQYDGWTICDTDNPCDLILIGTEVPSCQHIDKDPSYSKCLLAYLIDGKNRALVVKD